MNSNPAPVARAKKAFQLPQWAIIVLCAFLFLALFADFIANEKPLYCRYQGKQYLPVLYDYLVQTGLGRWPEPMLNIDWIHAEYEKVVRTPIPYSAKSLDFENAGFIGPFDRQNISHWRFRHWLGTDGLGRDVLAGMVRGCRIALFVGIFSMLLAAILGIPLGAAMGYFGNMVRVRWFMAVLALLGGTVLIYYGVQCIAVIMRGEESTAPWMIAFFVALLAFWGIYTLLKRVPWPVGRIRIPFDFLCMRGIELFKSIPVFFLLFSILGLIRYASVWYVLFLIALIRWPTIARYVRAEALRIRELPYILAARGIGLNSRQIIFRHVIPNALGPVFVTLAFGMGSAVLIESGLSFLGIGIPVDEVSWGKLLNEARKNFSAWWLAVFPGAAIFLLIASFHALGDSLQQYFQPRMRE